MTITQPILSSNSTTALTGFTSNVFSNGFVVQIHVQSVAKLSRSHPAPQGLHRNLVRVAGEMITDQEVVLDPDVYAPLLHSFSAGWMVSIPSNYAES